MREASRESAPPVAAGLQAAAHGRVGAGGRGRHSV